MKALVIMGALAGTLVTLTGCNSGSKAESGTPTAASAPKTGPASRPIDHMPPEAKAAMEAGRSRATGGGR